MLPSHGPSVMAIQRSIYPNPLHEEFSFIFARATAFPSGALVALDGATGAVLGYASAYPYPAAAALSDPPSLGELNAELIAAALRAPRGAALFIHEVSVHAQGRGIGKLLMQRLLGLGRELGLARAILVSVLGNKVYYEKMGFRLVRTLPSYAASVQLAPIEPPLPPTPSFFSDVKEADVMELEF